MQMVKESEETKLLLPVMIQIQITMEEPGVVLVM